ncbi:MAG: hypothetical protein K6G65_02490 [Lachnospiraceae bacterium]|nr:hypothetical protein [Lachnospiraceae bacterium]
MKVAFWSSQPGKNCVTSNMACMCFMEAKRQVLQQGKVRNKFSNRQMILLENHQAIDNLFHLMGLEMRDVKVREDLFYYTQSGMNQLLKRIHSKLVNQQAVMSSALEIVESYLFYLPQSKIINQELFDYDFFSVVKELMVALEETFGTVCIDTAVANNKSTETILQEADVVVINIRQDVSDLSLLKQYYQPLFKKAFFLVSNYSEASKLSLEYLSREYGIPMNRIGKIPYNVFYRDAIAEGDVISYLNECPKGYRRTEEMQFAKDIKETANKLWDYVDVIQTKTLYVGRDGVLKRAQSL